MPTMRTPPKAVEELKKKDPECPITAARLRRWIKQGKIKGGQIEKRQYVSVEAVEAFLEGEE